MVPLGRRRIRRPLPERIIMTITEPPTPAPTPDSPRTHRRTTAVVADAVVAAIGLTIVGGVMVNRASDDAEHSTATTQPAPATTAHPATTTPPATTAAPATTTPPSPTTP